MSVQSVAELLRKVQRIQIVANRSVNDLLAGQYRSVFRGRGMEFDEVREYQPGDEIRTIDWNVTARAGTPFIKRFSEERELTVLFMVDISASGSFGSGQQSKLDVMIEMAALLMFSALKNNDKVGLQLFASDVESYFPPRKGKSNVLRLIREMLAVEPVQQATSLETALQYLNRVQKRRAVVFLISDFQAEASRRSLAISNGRHDLVAITVIDPREQTLPNVGFVSLRDAESGELVEVDTRHPEVRRLFAEQAVDTQQQLSTGLRRAGVDQLSINTGESYATSLRRFFESRERRLR
ncbi:MAG: DUF58 domain-containing protein [Fuerstiella sp.]